MPRIKLAVLWAGIEGIFGASSEIRFRISLYIARFLHRDDSENRKLVFEAIKKLYNSRSAAVHGSKIKEDIGVAVETSANILQKSYYNVLSISRCQTKMSWCHNKNKGTLPNIIKLTQEKRGVRPSQVDYSSG